ncbi:MAG: GNAT family N-acetyltransferase [Armatimonadetes bacterium]|nr:GNAT family N-acetyltransferase [Armatimonadota bacterium]
MPEPYTGEPRVGFLNGERLYLRPVEPDDLPVMMRIANDPELRGLTGGVRPMSRSGADAWLASIEADPARLWFAVVLRERDRVIGEAGLLRIFHEWRAADMTVILADRSSWGKGYGTEAANLVIEHAFGALSLHRLAVGVVAANARAIRFWESLGFQREGIQRDGCFSAGRFHDFIMMSLLSTDHRPTRKGQLHPHGR